MAFNYANEADIAVLLAEVRKYVPFYASCSTAASTAAKEINDLTGFSLRTGATIRVKFTNSNTAQNPTLNVNNTGAKSIYKYGSSSAGITAGSSWESGAVVTLTYDGTAWIMNDWIDAEFSVMTGATSSTAGTSGLVPAPAAGSQEKYLKGDGTWGNPGGSRPIAYQLDTVTGTGGAYTHTTTDLPVTATMKATGIEVSDTTVFGGQITVTVNDGSITLSCPEVNGTSSVTVSVMQAGDAASGGQTVTSEEFDILSNRIGTMSALTTQTKTTVVGAVNEVNQKVGTKLDTEDFYATEMPMSGTDATTVNQKLTAISSDVGNIENGIAFIVDGDTCAIPVPIAGYAYIKNNTHGLANGLYQNVTNYAFPVSGGTADSTVFAAISEGGLNNLRDWLNSKPTVIPHQIRDTDLNTLTIPGTYTVVDCTNTPNNGNGWFSVEVLTEGGPGDGNTDYPHQRAIPMGTNNVYVRNRNSGVWSAWDSLALNSNMPKKTGVKTFSISQGTSVGDHSEWNVGNAKNFFELSNNNTIIGVFVANISSSFGSTFNHYIANDGNLYMRIDHAFTAGANALVQFYALYT